MTRIQPGQEYETCQPTFYDENGALVHTRIRVLGQPSTIPGVFGFGKVRVTTITADGREIRPRAIETAQLHPTGLTRDGQPRKTGYRLVRNADGTPAGAVSGE